MSNKNFNLSNQPSYNIIQNTLQSNTHHPLFSFTTYDKYTYRHSKKQNNPSYHVINYKRTNVENVLSNDQALLKIQNNYVDKNNQNISSILKIAKKVNHSKNSIKLNNNITKRNAKYHRKPDKKLLKIIRTCNNTYNIDKKNIICNNSINKKKSTTTKNTLTVNVIKDNIKSNDHVKVKENNNNDDYDVYDYNRVKGDNSRMTKNLNASIHFFEDTYEDEQQQQQEKGTNPSQLMRLVMDGLGFKKFPNMNAVNISQKEYVAKYREYLQRFYTRKRQHLEEFIAEYDYHISKPLELFSIVCSKILPNQQQNHIYAYHNEISSTRQKRNILEHNISRENYERHYSDKNNKGGLEERVKNVVLLKSKYEESPRSTKKRREERKTNIRLMFALSSEVLRLTASDISEANMRLVLIHSPILAIKNSKNKKHPSKHKKTCSLRNKKEDQKTSQVYVLYLKLFFLSQTGKRIWLNGQKVNIYVDRNKTDETYTQWLQFDVIEAVKTTINDRRVKNVVLDLQCDNCKRIGARILNDDYNMTADTLTDDPLTEGHQLMPVLNIIGQLHQRHYLVRPRKYYNQNKETTTSEHQYHQQTYSNNKRRSNCYKVNQRCCRHVMEVAFKEIKGFDFIIQPKVFDAGYCHGRCPPRFNPSHHHAMLQSLIWKQNHHKAPRLCCVPSKLDEVEVLHVDEKDSTKLKISTWSDMKVIECACS